MEKVYLGSLVKMNSQKVTRAENNLLPEQTSLFRFLHKSFRLNSSREHPQISIANSWEIAILLWGKERFQFGNGVGLRDEPDYGAAPSMGSLEEEIPCCRRAGLSLTQPSWVFGDD